MNGRILVVEDDATVSSQLSGGLEDEGHQVRTAGSVKQALAVLEAGEFDLVITDLRLPDASGLDVIARVRRDCPETPVLVITAYAKVDTAVEAMRRGAFHYLPKPFSLESLLAEVDKALEHGRALRERQALRERLSAEQGLGQILGEGPAIAALRRMITEVARSDATVLITGETGTGKELVANAVHYESPRAGGPLVKVNCAALSENLLESELFGHEKGAFTGAESRRAGRFERADGGTLLLDEITEMGSHLQAKLLRVLQGEAFERVGGDEQLQPDVRVVAATNRVPEQAVRDGKLREDLFYRLNVVRLEVPPLRKRLEDIPLLTASFSTACANRAGSSPKAVMPDALDALRAHNWPGNVRELVNCIERAFLAAGAEGISREHLPPLLAADAVKDVESGIVQDPAEHLNLKDVERRTIITALKQAGGNKAAAARLLGVYPASLYKKMKRLDIPIDKKS
jgi:two-component system, NtrC family, response regulator HydG